MLNKYRFINQNYSFRNPGVLEGEIVLTEIDADLPQLLEAFDRFLKGCGFSPKGTLEYVEDDIENLDQP